jgi:hypothetical protein
MSRLMRKLIRRPVRGSNAPSGRHRAGRRPTTHDTLRARQPESVPSYSTPAPTVRHWYEPLDGAANRLVRPYLTAHERGGTSRRFPVRAGAVA